MKTFGFFSWMPYGECTEDFDDYRQLKNAINKEKVVEHMEGLVVWATSLPGRDYFTGDRLQSGIYEDGEFVFPIDFLHYYKRHDIGIPYEYEEYLKSVGVGNES